MIFTNRCGVEQLVGWLSMKQAYAATETIEKLPGNNTGSLVGTHYGNTPAIRKR